MGLGRRDFLKRVALGAGAAGAAALAPAVLRPLLAGESGGEGSAGSPPPGKALTPDGRLVEVPAHGAAPCCPPGPSDPEARKGIPGRKWTMVIDLAKCDGCKSCTAACQKMHFIPPEREWIKVYKMGGEPPETPYWFPKPCLHCDNPPCTKVCPVGATYKRHDGIVLIDNERCIGCRFCMAACPYSTRFFNWGRPKNPPEASAQPYSPETGFPRRIGTVEKCDFCPHMAREGKLPACVTGCPMRAIYYGDANEDAVTNKEGETIRLTALLKDRAGYRFLEELGTQPRVYYLPPKNRLFPAPGEAGAGKHQGHGHE